MLILSMPQLPMELNVVPFLLLKVTLGDVGSQGLGNIYFVKYKKLVLMS
tara:strand:+ start:282 stop:428 length:147 start_codon:yes stop_codon:yes gene_type:complete